MLNVTIAVSNMFNPTKQNKLPPIQDQLILQPAHKLSKQIKDGSLSAVHLCQVYIDRIKQVNPTINAMTQDRFSEALEEAKRIDKLLEDFRNKPESEFSADQLEMLRSPLLGVPISVKESIQVRAMKNTCGLYNRREAVADEDAVVVKNVQRYGMIPICTTNVPEGTLYWADCHNTIYGRTVNPYDLSRITGASSGGEGSLIGSASSVIGIGSDIGGSLRIPAHYCGINSHKPSPFLVSSEGNFPAIHEYRLRLFTLGPMCRYASDLRPLLKCLMLDKDNSKKDTYFKYQPKNISLLREELILKLDQVLDLSQLKLFYFNFNSASKLKGKQSVHVNEEFMECQEEILNHFRSKFNCQTEQIDLDKYLKKTFITWQCMLMGGGTPDKDKDFNVNEMKETFDINSYLAEFIKIPLGISKHTKESLLVISIGSTIPKDKSKAFPLCEKFEQLGQDLKDDIERVLGDNGVLLMPTMPSVARKHNLSLLKTTDLRFPSLFNYLQLPVTHVSMRLDKKHKLPFGFSLACKSYQDHNSLALAEEIELTFGGWQQPGTTETSKLASATAEDPNQVAPSDRGAQNSDANDKSRVEKQASIVQSNSNDNSQQAVPVA